MTVALAAKSDNTYVDDQLALKANRSTTYTKTETDTALGLKANVTDMTSALATKANIVYVDGQVALKAKQLTTPRQR
ncbi:MAG: hypothetical protein ACKPKO_02970 [Candidatus Fonsibacter sp.]